MILYYTLGGGLGHISRSLALLFHAPEPLLPTVRLLVSSKSADAARLCSPCPMDLVPEWAMADRGLYFRFLDEYLQRYAFSCIVVDTFPFGLLGELRHPAPHLPRVLVGRYLRWDAYRERCGTLGGAVWPRVAVMIEEQERRYLEEAGRHSSIITAQWPVSLARPTDGAAPGVRPACCIVHSGPSSEMSILRDMARTIMAERGIPGTPEVFTPEKGLFPLEHHLSCFSDIVAGAGYASCAAAAVLEGRVRYHLHPFPRRFDDQALRLRRLRERRWGADSAGDAFRVAAIVWSEVESLTKKKTALGH
jgi:hypothetical protein